MPKTTFADRVQEAAKKHGIDNPADFARFMKVSPQTGYKWFTGQSPNISGKDLLKIANALKVRARWLMHGEGSPEAGRSAQSDEEWQLVTAFRHMTDEQRVLVRNLINHILGKGAGGIDKTGS